MRPWLLLLAAAVAPGAELSLTALDGAPRSLRSLQNTPVTVLVFLSAQCPVSNEYVGRLNALAQEYAGRATFLGVNANHNESLKQARQHAADYRLAFPVFKDPNNAAADQFGATVTPEAIVLDGENRVRYRGRIDDSQKPARVKRSDLRLAVEAALAGRAAPNEEARAFGCTIKRVTVELDSIADAAGYRAVLASHRGKVVLVNFWATWCAPCLEEMPMLAALERKLRDKGFVLVTISADEPEQRQAAGDVLAQHAIPRPAYIKPLADDDAFVRSVEDGWGAVIPALFFYDRSGRLARSFIGGTKISVIEREAARLCGK